jgi:hypothetical protein
MGRRRIVFAVLILTLVLICGCKKHSSPVPGPVPRFKVTSSPLQGLYRWSGTINVSYGEYSGQAYSVPGFPFPAQCNMFFSIVVVNDSTIKLSGFDSSGQDVLSYDTSNHSTDSATFTGIWDNLNYGGTFLRKQIIYNHKNGNISYNEGGSGIYSQGYTNFSHWSINVTAAKGSVPSSLLKSYTSKIGGKRSWFWNQYVSIPPESFQPFVYNGSNNVFFGVNVIDDTTLQTYNFPIVMDSFSLSGQLILNYSSTDSLSHSITYRSNRYFADGASLTYYYLKDSIFLDVTRFQLNPWIEIKILTQ